MCKESSEDQNWFYIESNRAMVSLGPLNRKKTCPYSCAFCYVQDGFVSYKQKNISEIIRFLRRFTKGYYIKQLKMDCQPTEFTALSRHRAVFSWAGKGGIPINGA